jgi:Bacterial Ig-like domain
MNLSIAAKFGLPAIALAAVLVACPEPVVPPVSKTTYTVSPADKATGVLETANVVLTFSAAMPDTAKSAVTLKDGTAAIAATSTWDATKKILTVDPTAALGFSKVITVAVAATKDAAGVDVDAKSTTFTVKAATTGTGGTKTGTLTADGSIVLDYATATAAEKFTFYATPPAPVGGFPVGDLRPGTFRVGDVSDAVARGALRFTLPAGVTAAQVATATLSIDQKVITGTPYTSLGGLQVQGADFGAALAADAADAGADYKSGTAAINGPIVEPGAVTKIDVDVTSYVIAQLTASKTNADLLVRFKTEPAAASGAQKDVRFHSSEAVAPNDTKKPALTITLK